MAGGLSVAERSVLRESIAALRNHECATVRSSISSLPDEDIVDAAPSPGAGNKWIGK